MHRLFITGHYKKSKGLNRFFLNDVSAYQIIPFDCVLNEIICYFDTLNNNDYLTLNVGRLGLAAWRADVVYSAPRKWALMSISTSSNG